MLLLFVLMATACSGSTGIESEARDDEPEAQAEATHLSAAPLPSVGPFAAVATGRQHTCAIRVEGTIACWGDNRFGQSDPPDGSFTAVTSDHSHNCAIRVEGTIECWGGSFGTEVVPPDGDFAVRVPPDGVFFPA